MTETPGPGDRIAPTLFIEVASTGACSCRTRLAVTLAALVGIASIASAAELPKIHVDKPVLEVGRVIAGDVVPLQWRIENQGDADLFILRTQASCGCTVVDLKDKDRRIPPGGHLDLEAKFSTVGRAGEQGKQVTVYSNDPDHPQVELEFHAYIDRLFEVIPSQFVNLLEVQRGQKVSKTIDVVEGYPDKPITDLRVDTGSDTSLHFDVQPLAEGKNFGKRIVMTVSDTVAIGHLSTKATLAVTIGGKTRTHNVLIRGTVVGDITWQPRVVDATRTRAKPGHRLAPVFLRSDANAAFRVTAVDPIPGLDVEVTPAIGSKASKNHRVTLTVRADAKPGPYGAMLRIRTDSLDQPLIEIPVYGYVEPGLKLDPPSVALVADGTSSGTKRNLQLTTHNGDLLKITSVSCSVPGVSAAAYLDSDSPRKNIRFIAVSLDDASAATGKSGQITVETNVPGFEHVEIPVTVRAAKPAGMKVP